MARLEPAAETQRRGWNVVVQSLGASVCLRMRGFCLRVGAHWKTAKLAGAENADKADHLRSILGAQNWIRVIIAVSLAFFDRFPRSSIDQKGEASIVPIFIVWTIIGIALLLHWGYFTRPDFRTIPPKNALLVDAFPFLSFVLDIVYLTILLFATGGVTSVFLPLAVIALISGDVAIETKKNQGTHVWPWLILFFVIVVPIGTLIPLAHRARCIFFGFEAGSSNCPTSVWQMSEGWTGVIGTIVFVLSAGFGSYVLRSYIKRQQVNGTAGGKPTKDKV